MACRNASEICAYISRTIEARAVFVEGPTDARILNRAFVDCGRPEIIAYPITTVNFDDIPDTPNSNRSKCLLVAAMLASQCPDSGSGKVLCVVDSDFALYDCDLTPLPFVVYTDHADLLLYFAQENVLNYLTAHILGDNVSLTSVLDQVFDVCTSLFAARYALRRIAPTIGFVDDPSRACLFENERIVLDKARLAAQILSPRNAMTHSADLQREMARVVPRSDLPITAQINGHDFVSIFRYALVRFGRGRVTRAFTDAAVEAMIYAAQPAARLCETSLIRTIAARICALRSS